MSKLAAGAMCALVLYFAYHAFAGDSGLGRYSDMQRELKAKQSELNSIETEIAALEDQIRRLTPGTEDPAFIERLAREKLAFVYPGELVMID